MTRLPDVIEIPSMLPGASDTRDAITIRGVTLLLAELVDYRRFTPDAQAALRSTMLAAEPFAHVVIKDLFNPQLLDLVAEEFDLFPQQRWAHVQSAYESTWRSSPGARLGPAAQIYFDLINASWFVQWLSNVIGVPYLLPDPQLVGGGLHESRGQAHFAIHRDFQFHGYTGLRNELVMLTYLNHNWRSEWGAQLELWDRKRSHCVTRIAPEFGHTVLMPHGMSSYHGHPEPMRAPDGHPRRSLGAYYYSSPLAGRPKQSENHSLFLNTRASDRI